VGLRVTDGSTGRTYGRIARSTVASSFFDDVSPRPAGGLERADPTCYLARLRRRQRRKETATVTLPRRWSPQYVASKPLEGYIP